LQTGRGLRGSAGALIDTRKDGHDSRLCEFEEKTIRLYAEAKLNYPELGDLIEKRWPHLDLLSEARLKKRRNLAPLRIHRIGTPTFRKCPNKFYTGMGRARKRFKNIMMEINCHTRL